MLLFMILLGVVPDLILVWGIWRFFRARRGDGFGSRMLRTLGWQALWVLPALAGTIYTAFDRYSASLADLPLMMPVSWWVLLGGASVQGVFEVTAKAISGHRQFTMIDNYPWYLTLTAVQAALVSGIGAIRLKKVKSFRDPALRLLGAAVLLNALAGSRWPWWGS